MSPPVPDVHVPLKSWWPIVPEDDMAYKGPFRDIDTSACPTNITQYYMMDTVLVPKIQGGG